MKGKPLVGLIGIVAIAAVVMFAGCVEKETPAKIAETTETITPPAGTPTPVTSTPTVTLTPTQTPISVEANIKVVHFDEWFKDQEGQRVNFTEMTSDPMKYFGELLFLKTIWESAKKNEVTNINGTYYWKGDGLPPHSVLEHCETCPNVILLELPSTSTWNPEGLSCYAIQLYKE